MKKSKYISLVLITAALASCNRQEREEDGWYVDVNFNWPNYYNYRHWRHHQVGYAHFHNGYAGRGGFGHSGHGHGGHA
jgi:hypothetical protein